MSNSDSPDTDRYYDGGTEPDGDDEAAAIEAEERSNEYYDRLYDELSDEQLLGD